MPTKNENKQTDSNTELLKDLLITELAKVGVPQLEIRKIVGCDIYKVSRIARYIKKEKER
ncbi:MAG TPA: hypothetical protein VKV95_17620 [Terriglobia bacterium]|nr:hypothetical protein [Terriglobia bacterium]